MEFNNGAHGAGDRDKKQYQLNVRVSFRFVSEKNSQFMHISLNCEVLYGN